jgi:surface antigen
MPAPAIAPRRAGALIALLVLAAAPAAQAQIGGNAEAQGWRNQSSSSAYFLGAGERKWLQDYGVLEGHCNRQAVAGVLAAGPSGPETPRSEVATLRGDIPLPRTRHTLGAVERACLGHALELAPEGRTVYWADPTAGYTYRITPMRSFSALGWPCRELTVEVTRGKQTPEVVRTRACRTEDGVWGISA